MHFGGLVAGPELLRLIGRNRCQFVNGLNRNIAQNIWFASGCDRFTDVTTMRKTLLALATVLTAFTGSMISAPASAQDYRYCLQSRELGYPGDCSYQSYAQCQAAASGRLASCGVNPRTAFGQSSRMRISRDYRTHY